MLDKPLHFPNAPIAEAIFAIEAPARFSVSPAEFKAAARDAIPEDAFPEMRDIFKIGMRFEGNLATGETQAGSESNWQGVAFQGGEDSQVIQFRSNGMSFHQLQPYTSHETIMPLLQQYWRIFAELAHPKSTTRQSLRFINRIRLPEEASMEEVDAFTRITPTFALVDQLEAQHLLSRVRLRDPETGILAFVTFALPDPNKRPLELIFDIDVVSQRAFGVPDPEIWEDFSRLRDLKNRIFCGSLHQKCLDLFA